MSLAYFVCREPWADCMPKEIPVYLMPFGKEHSLLWGREGSVRNHVRYVANTIN